MPRLLLVDDNPSIHRIAESLLAPTDVELVCVDSAAEALDRIGRGERFDVALVDTAMPGMDGWTLLGRLRGMDETARMPIALMAGVLDPVDPSKLAKAPIQGFLKKPIELRELGDRVKALLVATVPPPGPSPFSTVPATPARELVQRAEAALPELRPELLPEPLPEPASEPTPEFVPELTSEFAPEFTQELALDEVFTHDDLLAQAAADLVSPREPALHDDDILVLTAEDLWPEEPAPALAETALAVPEAPSAMADVHLELEELDLDSLQDLTAAPLPEAEPAVPVLAAAEAEPALAPSPAPEPVPSPLDEDHIVTLSGLEELETLAPEALTAPDFPEPATGGAEAFALPAAGLAAALTGAGSGLPAAAGGQTAAAAGQGASPTGGPTGGSVSSDQTQALVQALLTDPVLVDALVKAVVARMGDQVLREIAWEVMPDLAGRLQR